MGGSGREWEWEGVGGSGREWEGSASEKKAFAKDPVQSGSRSLENRAHPGSVTSWIALARGRADSSRPRMQSAVHVAKFSGLHNHGGSYTGIT